MLASGFFGLIFKLGTSELELVVLPNSDVVSSASSGLSSNLK